MKSKKVKILKFSPETDKISLGIKQLSKDPWNGIEKKALQEY